MDMANHTDETKWLLPAYVADKPHQPKYSPSKYSYYGLAPSGISGLWHLLRPKWAFQY